MPLQPAEDGAMQAEIGQAYDDAVANEHWATANALTEWLIRRPHFHRPQRFILRDPVSGAPLAPEIARLVEAALKGDLA